MNYRTWQKRFAGAADIVGCSLDLDGIAVTVVGVARPGFIGVECPDRSGRVAALRTRGTASADGDSSGDDGSHVDMFSTGMSRERRSQHPAQPVALAA
jgi:hypothetical protein